MVKLTDQKKMVSSEGQGQEMRMVAIMWVPTEQGAALQRRRYKQVASTLHGDRHTGCALYFLWKVALCYGVILGARLHACDSDLCALAECHSSHFPIQVDPELPLVMLYCVETVL